jgi:hypothetical protein
MKRCSVALSVGASLAVLWLTLGVGQAQTGQLSPERFDELDKWGYLTPGFKAAVHDYVESKHALEQANAENAKFAQDVPVLQKQADDAAKKTAALQMELAKYDKPDEADFAALKNEMSDPNAALKDQIAMAQAYVWSYPTSTNEGEAQQYLQQAQKKLADQVEAEKEAEAQRAADHAKMVQRALARDLSVSEWRDFLRDMSQDDLVELLGRPNSTADDYWTYSGAWVLDRTTHQKVGIQINFNAGRVLNVDEIPPPP